MLQRVSCCPPRVTHVGVPDEFGGMIYSKIYYDPLAIYANSSGKLCYLFLHTEYFYFDKDETEMIPNISGVKAYCISNYCDYGEIIGAPQEFKVQKMESTDGGVILDAYEAKYPIKDRK